MTTLYKLTDANGCTRGNTQWGENVQHEAKGSADQDLCSDGWIHAYEHPLLAVLFNPIHANLNNPILWEAEGEIGKRDGLLKCGCRSLKTIKKVPLPTITTLQHQAFAILVAKEVYKDSAFQRWTDDWLSGKDRSTEAADAARAAVADAAAAAWAAAAWVAWTWEAARAAAEAAAAAWAAAAWVAWTWEAARAAAEAAEAARAAAWSAQAAAASIDFIALANKAITEF